MSLSAAKGRIVFVGAALGADHGAGAFHLAGGLDALFPPVMAVHGLDPGRLSAAGAMGGAHIDAHRGGHTAGIVIRGVAHPLPVTSGISRVGLGLGFTAATGIVDGRGGYALGAVRGGAPAGLRPGAGMCRRCLRRRGFHRPIGRAAAARGGLGGVSGRLLVVCSCFGFVFSLIFSFILSFVLGLILGFVLSLILSFVLGLIFGFALDLILSVALSSVFGFALSLCL